MKMEEDATNRTETANGPGSLKFHSRLPKPGTIVQVCSALFTFVRNFGKFFQRRRSSSAKAMEEKGEEDSSMELERSCRFASDNVGHSCEPPSIGGLFVFPPRLLRPSEKLRNNPTSCSSYKGWARSTFSGRLAQQGLLTEDLNGFL
jgi:hypothetical protein